MPTRLLDWTANPLAGLWFAVSSAPPEDEGHGVVWVLEDPNEQTFDSGQDIFKLPRTIFFQPPHLDRRIIAQAGWFSVYRHNRTRFLALENMDKYRNKIKKFIIPKDRFYFLRQELRLLGTESCLNVSGSLGLGAEIQTEINDSWERIFIQFQKIAFQWIRHFQNH